MSGEPSALRGACSVREQAFVIWPSFIEYSDYQKEDGSKVLSFDSYMRPEEDLHEGDLRLLEVDNPLVLPSQTHVNVVVTATDVLHSWSVPSLGIKIDAIPGRLNQISLFIKREGGFYGQCSEICGVNHGFMVRGKGSDTMETQVSGNSYKILPVISLGKMENIVLNIAYLFLLILLRSKLDCLKVIS